MDDLIAGTFGAITATQTQWLNNLNASEREVVDLIVGIWGQNTNSGATTGESGSDFMGICGSPWF